MRTRLYIFIILCLSAMAISAQDIRTPDLQTVGDGFFDPNAKPKKVREEYNFAYHLLPEASFAQIDMRTIDGSQHLTYLNGARLGLSVSFDLPYWFSVQTGLMYTIASGRYTQRYRSLVGNDLTPYTQQEYIDHRVLQHQLTIPMRVYYSVPLPKKWGLFFYTGPQMQIGLAHSDKLDLHLSSETVHDRGALQWLQAQGVRTESADRYREGELRRFTIEYGIGGGVEYQNVRLQAGYDFGLNNISTASPRMWTWTWNIGLAVRIR